MTDGPLAKNERFDIQLREAEGKNPQGLLRDLVETLNDLIPDAGNAASNWMVGKGNAEVAKALEIKATVMTKIAGIEQEQQRLIIDRDHSMREAERLDDQARCDHRQKMYELRTARLKEAVDCVMRLRDLGASVSVKVLDSLSKEILAAAREKP